MECSTISIAGLKDMYKKKQIELDPPYQRRSVWNPPQRKLLLSSLFNGIPIPALIFHKRIDIKKGKEVYDVLDGKQRLETIFHFIELKELEAIGKLEVEFKNPKTGKKDSLSYDNLKLKKVNKEYENILEKFWGYKIPIIQYEGELTDIFGSPVVAKDFFVRINSTGSPLKKHEIKHALFSDLARPFFELGNKLEKKYKNDFLKKWKIISKTDVERYLFHEFILELCTACHFGDYSDKRKELDELLRQHKTKKEIDKLKKKFTKIVSWVKDMFPNDEIKHTRFRNKSDFYSLFVVLLKLEKRGYVTSDKKSNKVAGKFLLNFSKQILKLDSKIDIKKFHQIKLSESEKKLFPYVNSTRYATDTKKNRETRDNFLMSVLKDGFFLKTKDSKRIFDKNVKDILWIESTDKLNHPKCPNPFKNRKCKVFLTYENAEVDHKYPWNKGGRTKIDNAQLLCSSCNKVKSQR